MPFYQNPVSPEADVTARRYRISALPPDGGHRLSPDRCVQQQTFEIIEAAN